MKIIDMEDKRCRYCGRTENLEWNFTEWTETIHNGGGPGTYRIEHETEGWFCKDGVLIPGEDESDPANYESCWEKHLEDIDNV